jgi:diguanylate cyclase (GGDEF)-like protein
MFDLDQFKSINDRFGHQTGDDVSRLFAAVASANFRASDLIGRLGGEEFAVVMPGSLADAATAAERTRQAFAAAAVSVDGRQVGATVSVGAACRFLDADVASLLITADATLFRAKAKGRNRVEVAENEMPTIFTTAPPPDQDDRAEGALQRSASPHVPAREPALAA